MKPQDANTGTDKDLVATIQTLKLFNTSLRDTFENKMDPFWIDNDKIEILLHDDTLLTMFIGLVTQVAKNDNIEFKDKSLYNELNNIGPEKVGNFISIIRSFQNNIKEIRLIQENHSKQKNKEEKEIHAIRYFDATDNLLKTFKNINEAIHLNISEVKIDSVLNLFSNINGLVKNIVTKKYSNAALHLSEIMKRMHFKSSESTKGLLTFMVEKSIFIAQMAEAESSDQIANIIETFAAPSGSWRDKKQATTNIAIDSYIGPSLFLRDTKVRYALSTPIGLSFSKSLGKGWATTFLGSLIDLGPLTAYRFQNDTLGIAKIYLKEIFAPGFHINILIPICDCLPLSVSAGYQQLTLLEKVGQVQNEVNIKKARSLVFSINYNIPLFTIHNRKKF
ncbi:MAG: hypothetical protein IPO92_16090 [Saprospiraceae bacterium]|nr:hypothetical protein [Saprospiraceae bacterium]